MLDLCALRPLLIFTSRLAPEHPFPAPFEDSYTAAKWVRSQPSELLLRCFCAYWFLLQAAENAASLGADIKKGFLVGGDSAGGNIASAVALKARDDPFFESRPLTGQYLREPATVHPTQWPEKCVFLVSHGQYGGELMRRRQAQDEPKLARALRRHASPEQWARTR